MDAAPRQPEGMVALLFTDIVGSTRMAASLGSAWGGVLADHHALVGAAIAAEGGFVAGTQGDSFFCTFWDAVAAARAAVEAFRALRAHQWPEAVGELEVRMGLHVGFAELGAGGYVGLEVHRAARVAAAAHGGQLLVTAPARAVLGDTVAVEPLGAHRLKDFPAPELLFCAVVDGRGASAFPPLATQELRPTNLPAGAPVLLGREGDLERVRSALVDEGERFVTLTGRGGAGKTSLALVAATELLDQHPGGVWLVRLAGVSAPAEVLPAVASAIGAEGDASGSPLEAIVARLNGRGPTLIVLDNMEHVTGAAAELGVLLDAVPHLRLLVTSQVPLRLAAERCVPLDALDDEAALALIERVAQRRGAAVSTVEADRAALLEVAHLLDGLPLALELAAARLALLSPAQLGERLRESSDLLIDAAGARPDRHRSLSATVEWTLGNLKPSPRKLFVRMGAFAGAVELEDLEAVAGGDGLDVLEALARLLDFALVGRVESGDGRVRFELPQALRQNAARLLDAAPDGQRWRRAHAERQLELAWAARTPWVPRAVYVAATAADAEADAALHWAQAAGDPVAAPLGAARASLLTSNGRVREARALLGPLVEAPSGDLMADSLALAAHASALAVGGHREESMAAGQRAFASATDPQTRILALIVCAMGYAFRGELDVAIRNHEQATEIAREIGPSALAGALLREAQTRLFLGQLDRASDQLAEAELIGGPVDANELQRVDILRGGLAMRMGRPDQALAHFARSLAGAHPREAGVSVLLAIRGAAVALAELGADAEALEAAALAEAQASEVSGPGGRSLGHPLGGGSLEAAEQRLGPTVAAELKARGHAVPAGYRVARACQLAAHTSS